MPSSTATHSAEPLITTVRNRTPAPASFVLAPVPCKFLPLTVPPSLHIGAYQASRLVAPGSGSHTFVAPPPAAWLYAVAGCARVRPGAGVRLFVSDARPVGSRGAACAVGMPADCEARFADPAGSAGSGRSSPTLGAGSDGGGGRGEAGIETEKAVLRIEVDSSFGLPHPDFPFVGLGARSPHNEREIIPFITWEAVPGSTYALQLDLAWTVGRGSAERGEVVDASAWSEKNSFRITGEVTEREIACEPNGGFVELQ